LAAQSARLLELNLIVADQGPNEDVGVYVERYRDNISMGTGFLPFLYSSPASLETDLFFTRMMTTPSGINVKLILSPAFMCRASRIFLGIVV
jgi:hypothetical protein